MSDLIIEAAVGKTRGWASFGPRRLQCALGRGGMTDAKVEGDGCTPTGRFPIRRLLFRPDRIRDLALRIPSQALSPADGWCDDPADPNYNRAVARPYSARHERLWREDALYDLILVIGHNDDPVVSGQGSAVFLHLANPEFGPTDGCVAFGRSDFIALLSVLEPATWIRIERQG